MTITVQQTIEHDNLSITLTARVEFDEDGWKDCKMGVTEYDVVRQRTAAMLSAIDRQGRAGR